MKWPVMRTKQTNIQYYYYCYRYFRTNRLINALLMVSLWFSLDLKLVLIYKDHSELDHSDSFEV